MRLKEMVNLNAFTISTNCVDFQVEMRGQDLENVQLDVKPSLSDKEVPCYRIFVSLTFAGSSQRDLQSWQFSESFLFAQCGSCEAKLVVAHHMDCAQGHQ